MRVVAVDPGLNRSGVAVFSGGRLVEVTTVSRTSGPSLPLPERVRVMADAITEFVYPIGSRVSLAIEFPQIYQRGAGKSKGNPNSLTPLAALAGLLMASFASTAFYLPSEWKGQLTKQASHARIKERLTASETGRVPPRLAHDGWDAIGIGLHYLGRFERRRVFPGAT